MPGEKGGSIVCIEDALDTANKYGLDLVEISSNEEYPICKIMDYGKYRFDMVKREKKHKKLQKAIEIKEIHMSPNIGKNDLNTKVTAARKFLQKGHKVIVSVQFRGRGITYLNNGNSLLRIFENDVADISTSSGIPKLEGKVLSVTFNPIR